MKTTPSEARSLLTSKPAASPCVFSIPMAGSLTYHVTVDPSSQPYLLQDQTHSCIQRVQSSQANANLVCTLPGPLCSISGPTVHSVAEPVNFPVFLSHWSHQVNSTASSLSIFTAVISSIPANGPPLQSNSSAIHHPRSPESHFCLLESPQGPHTDLNIKPRPWAESQVLNHLAQLSFQLHLSFRLTLSFQQERTASAPHWTSVNIPDLSTSRSLLTSWPGAKH